MAPMRYDYHLLMLRAKFSTQVPQASRKGPPWASLGKSLLRLLRPGNALIAGAGVLVGAACLPGPMPWGLALLGFGIMAALAAGGNAENDVCDLTIDRRNRPDRPLPSGAVTSRQALVSAYALYSLALAASWFVSPTHALLVAGMIVLLIAYNRLLKRLPLWGNLAVSLLCALALIFTEWPAWPKATAIAAGFAFLTTLLREILKDIEDMPGDGENGLRTAPLVFGVPKTKAMATALCLLILLLLPLPLALGWTRLYGMLALMGPAPLLLGIGLKLTKPTLSPAEAGVLQRRVKWVMLAGLVALLAGALAQKFANQ